MKKIVLVLAIVISFICARCVGKDQEANSFINDSDKLVENIVQKINEDPTIAGIAEAQKMLDDKKDEVKTKYKVLKSLNAYGIKEQTMKNITESVFRNTKIINSLGQEFIEKRVGNNEFNNSLNKLIDDFNMIYEV